MAANTILRMCALSLLLLCSFFRYSLLQNPSTSHWNYQREGPDTWQHTYDTCEGEAQSPIDIRTSRVKYDPSLSPLTLNGFRTYSSLHVWNFTHNGHTIVASPSPLANLSISGAGLSEFFYLAQIHFHWGYNAYQGSEHTIDGIKYPLEVHFVHQGRHSGALAVLSILFERRADDNPRINELLSILNQTTDSSVYIERQIDLSCLFPTAPLLRFYRYDGSLTTPPCTEGVTWIILARRMSISAHQLEVFVRNSVPFNFRPPQKLYLRTVSANFLLESEDEVGEHTPHSSAYGAHVSSLLFSFLLVISSRKIQP